MSILINGMEMPKQMEVQTDKGKLKLWTIRNHKVGQDIQFGAAAIPCDLNFNHDGTIQLSALGRRYTLTDVPTPHGRLIDADKLHSILLDMWQSDCNQSFIDAIREVGGMPTIIEAEE